MKIFIDVYSSSICTYIYIYILYSAAGMVSIIYKKDIYIYHIDTYILLLHYIRY